MLQRQVHKQQLLRAVGTQASLVGKQEEMRRKDVAGQRMHASLPKEETVPATLSCQQNQHGLWFCVARKVKTVPEGKASPAPRAVWGVSWAERASWMGCLLLNSTTRDMLT